jgi:hypothetical protein
MEESKERRLCITVISQVRIQIGIGYRCGLFRIVGGQSSENMLESEMRWICCTSVNRKSAKTLVGICSKETDWKPPHLERS